MDNDEPRSRALSRSSLEAYSFGILTILLTVVPMTWWLRGMGLLCLIPIMLDLTWRSPHTINIRKRNKLLMCIAAVALVTLIGIAILPAEYKKEHPVPRVVIPSVPAKPAIEVSILCRFETFPIVIPAGETVQFAGLIPEWPRADAPINEQINSKKIPMEWPTREQIGHKKAGGDLWCEFTNHTEDDVLELTAPFHVHFGIDPNIKWQSSSVFINPLDKHKSRIVRLVGYCPRPTQVMIPNAGTARLAGESTVRGFTFELDQPGFHSFEIGGTPVNWVGATCPAS
jgi:hypothetical protein